MISPGNRDSKLNYVFRRTGGRWTFRVQRARPERPDSLKTGIVHTLRNTENGRHIFGNKR